jgi:uncharacterized membrane protein YccC
MKLARADPARLRAIVGAGRVGDGLRLAAAVVLAYLGSAVLGLPESLWSVMSALIVMRPGADATLGAGRQRLGGTLLGIVGGLLGVWLGHRVGDFVVPMLLVVAALACIGGIFASLRSAPIASLLVLSGAGSAAGAPLRIAALRVAEIGIGIASSLLVAWLSTPKRGRFEPECAAVLRLLATSAIGSPERRIALRRLALQAEGVERQRKMAGLVSRAAHGALERLRDTAPPLRDDPAWAEVAQAARDALASAANVLRREGVLELAPLRRAGEAAQAACAGGACEAEALLAGSARLLARDLDALVRLAQASPSA